MKTGDVLPAGSFASISIAELQLAADAAAAAAAADLGPNPDPQVVFEIHVRRGRRARELLPRVEVTRRPHLFSIAKHHTCDSGVGPAGAGAPTHHVSSSVKLQLS
jgi:hypothetical protein